MKEERLPDEQDKVQHNMVSELPNWPRIGYIPLVMYCHCGEILNNTSFNNCQKCGTATKYQFNY